MGFKDLIAWAKSLDNDEIGAYKMALIFYVVIDMVAFYWYFKWKSLAIASMIVALVLLGILLFLERRKEDTMVKKEYDDEEYELVKKKKPEEKPKEKKEDKDEGNGFDFGLPDADEYNKRLDKAFGGGF